MTIETPNSDASGSHTSGEDDNTNGHDNGPKWWIDEGVPGVGDRPNWLNEKFKSAAELAKSQQELEKRLGTAPDNYDFTKSKYLDPDYAPFKDLQDYAKSKRVPQDVMDKVLESVDKYIGEFTTNDDEEIKKLGDNAQERLTTLHNWAKANLSQDAVDSLVMSLRTADGVKALEELRNKMMSNSTQVPNGNDKGPGDGNTVSMAEIQEELNNNLDKFKTDPKYRKEMQGKMAMAAKYSDYVDKTM